MTIVDQRNFHTFQPLLYEVATAGLEAGDVAYPVRAIFGRSRNVTFRFGRVTGVAIYVDTDVQEYYQIGQRLPVSLNPERIAIRGEIERAYMNGALLFLLLGRGASKTAVKEPYVQPTFSMTVALSDPAVPANKASLQLKGVKFLNWGVSVPDDDFVMEKVKFKALTISVIDSAKPPKFK